MFRVGFGVVACLSLAGCVTNTLSTQNAQLATPGAAGATLARAAPVHPAPMLTPAARITSAALVTISKVTTPGATLVLGSPQALAPDCTPLGDINVKVIEEPAHGVLHVQKGTAFSNFTPGDPPYACNARRTPATVITYRAEAGYAGSDGAVVEVFFPDGKAPTIRFNISVR